MFNIKNRRYTVWGMVAVLVFSVLIIVDAVFLPYQQSEETIEYYGIRRQVRSREVVGYYYYTNKGGRFSIDKDYIRGSSIVLKRTLLFKQIVQVKTSTRDYTPLLSSGSNGFTLVLFVILAFSCGISLYKLGGNEPMTVNRYQNFVMFPAFFLFCTVCMWFLFN